MNPPLLDSSLRLTARETSTASVTDQLPILSSF
jgi:hypothetical protein